MLSISDLKIGELALVLELPANGTVRKALLEHGIHIGGKIKLMQQYSAQGLALITYNGRRIALRKPDCQSIKVVVVDE